MDKILQWPHYRRLYFLRQHVEIRTRTLNKIKKNTEELRDLVNNQIVLMREKIPGPLPHPVLEFCEEFGLGTPETNPALRDTLDKDTIRAAHVKNMAKKRKAETMYFDEPTTASSSSDSD